MQFLDKLDPYLNGYALAGLMAIAIGLFVYGLRGVLRDRRKPAAYEPEMVRDWLPTGRINAVADTPIMLASKDDIPAAFILLVEEDRQIADIGGDPVTEIRWRAATRKEVRRIVARYHTQWHSQDTLRTRSPFDDDADMPINVVEAA